MEYIILIGLLLLSISFNLKQVGQKDKLAENIQELEEKMKRLFSVKQSKAVRRGQSVEQIAPFYEDFPHYGKDIVPCFKPIDYVVFDNDEIILVELKTGSSNLSKKQSNIKRIVKEGKVRFEEVRVTDNGFKSR